MRKWHVSSGGRQSIIQPLRVVASHWHELVWELFHLAVQRCCMLRRRGWLSGITRIVRWLSAMEAIAQVAQLTERLEQIVVEGVHLHVGRRTTGAIYEQQKAALFGALALMTPQDRERLDGLLAAVEAVREDVGKYLKTLE